MYDSFVVHVFKCLFAAYFSIRYEHIIYIKSGCLGYGYSRFGASLYELYYV